MAKLTKTRQQQVKQMYKNSYNYNIYCIYKNPSYYKVQAESYILGKMALDNGWGYRVLGGNSSTFSCAYLRNNKENGQIEIVYHTAQNVYIFDF